MPGECYDESYWRKLRPDTVPVTQPVKLFLSNQMIKLLEKKGYQVILPCRPDEGLRERRQRGKDHPLFGFTIVGRQRLDNFEKLVRAADESGVPGAIVECGV